MTKAEARQRIMALFTTLANGRQVIVDWQAGDRGEYRDVFAIHNNSYTQAICGGAALTLRIDQNKDGKVREGRAETCAWSIAEMVDYAQALTDDEFSRLDTPCERRPAVQRLARLIDQGNACINGTTYSCEWGDDDMGIRYVITSNSRDENYSADELLATR